MRRADSLVFLRPAQILPPPSGGPGATELRAPAKREVKEGKRKNVGKLSGWLSEKYELTEEENSKICREEEFQTQAQLKPLKRERRVFDLANLSDMETSMQHSSSTVGFSGDAGVTAVMNDPVAVDEARQILKLDSRSIERLMLQDEKLASKLEYLYAKTGDFKLRKAISVAKWRIRYWLRKP
jgi:hypothetical protein